MTVAATTTLASRYAFTPCSPSFTTVNWMTTARRRRWQTRNEMSWRNERIIVNINDAQRTRRSLSFTSNSISKLLIFLSRTLTDLFQRSARTYGLDGTQSSLALLMARNNHCLAVSITNEFIGHGKWPTISPKILRTTSSSGSVSAAFAQRTWFWWKMRVNLN